MDDTSADATAIARLRAGAHPLRLRILSLLTGAEMSAAEVARELDITHANASYHLRVLAEAGQVVEAGEERIRGGVAKRYRHPWRDQRLTADTPEERQAIVRAAAEELIRRVVQHRPRTRLALSDAELWVSPDVWKRVSDLVKEASELLHAEAKPPRTRGTVHVNMTSVLFQMKDGPR
jgi:DNA-binding transcriptional ArsR family regulator